MVPFWNGEIYTPEKFQQIPKSQQRFIPEYAAVMAHYFNNYRKERRSLSLTAFGTASKHYKKVLEKNPSAAMHKLSSPKLKKKIDPMNSGIINR